jgi:tetratricopeptide (TPR) repeat protein
MNATVKELLASGLSLHRNGRPREAEPFYQRVLAVDPGQPDALYLLGMTALQRGDNAGAAELIAKALERNRAAPEYHANLAIALQNLDRNDEAVASCLAALKLQPGHFSALNTMGNALMKLAKQDEAVECFRKAIALKPDLAEIHFNLASAFRVMGKLNDAADACRSVIALKPDHVEAHYLLGTALKHAGRTDEAASALETAIRLKPQHAEALNMLGNVLTDQGKLDDALVRYQQAIQSRPDHAEALYNLGNVQGRLSQHDHALDRYRAALLLKPGFVDAVYGLARTLYELEQYNEAERYYRSALSMKPDMAPAYNGLGNTLRVLGKMEDALNSYRTALELHPEFAECYYNMSNVQFDMGLIDEAIESCERSIALSPDLPEAHWNMAFALLAKGDLTAGWPKYEYRLFKKDAAKTAFSQPDWEGSSLDGKILLVNAEQGVGDEIMFASCFSDVISTAKACIVECDNRLAPLFARSFPQARFITRTKNASQLPDGMPAPDVKIAAGSLPRFFRSSFKHFPAHKGYLIADGSAVARWRERLDQLGPGLKVGISWRGGRKAIVRRNRSTTLDQWRDLLLMQNVCFINLQYGDCTDELKAVQDQDGITIHDWDDSDPMRDLDDFAAKIAALDLVISVDNSTVHLAGALGVPIWTLLPFGCDWRWMRDVDDTPWYPSMRLFRQQSFGDWDKVFNRVAQCLSASSGSEVSSAPVVRSFHSIDRA